MGELLVLVNAVLGGAAIAHAEWLGLVNVFAAISGTLELVRERRQQTRDLNGLKRILLRGGGR